MAFEQRLADVGRQFSSLNYFVDLGVELPVLYSGLLAKNLLQTTATKCSARLGAIGKNKTRLTVVHRKSLWHFLRQGRPTAAFGPNAVFVLLRLYYAAFHNFACQRVPLAKEVNNGSTALRADF
jgi:hypothetical protein